MGVQGKRHRGFRKLGSNPYAERGLDKFALVSAELEAKRERLVAQLGTQLSFVRFAVGSDHKGWIPVIVCPTLSKAEICALKRTATRLMTEERAAATNAARGHQLPSPGFSICESNVHDGSYDRKNASDLDRNCDQAGSDDEDTQTCTVGTLGCLFAATERCFWMAAFTFSIAVDVISNLFLSKRHAAESPLQRVSPSTSRPKEESDCPSPNMSSSVSFSPLPSIRTPASIAAKGIKVTTPSHSPAHAGAHKTHNGFARRGFSATAPSTPKNSRQVQKSFQASVSFPTASHRQDEAPHTGTTKDSKFVKSVSLPKTACASSRVILRSPQSMAKPALTEKERKERAEKFGQALTGAGLILGLGGLVMGYVPAIVCVVCWWYALPNLRKAVGDKPHVKSHHLIK